MLPFFAYDTPTASPFDDIEQYIGILLGAVDETLDRPDVWKPGEEATAQGYMEDLKAYIQELSNMFPVGGVLDYAGAEETIPSNFLLCKGQAVSRTTYSRLFAAIGEIYGDGDGVNTFNLPDYRARFRLGADDPGNDYAFGVFGGVASVTLGIDEVPAHKHTMDSHSHTTNPHNHAQTNHVHSITGRASSGGVNLPVFGVGATADLVINGGGSAANLQNATVSVNGAVATMQNAGGGLPHNNMPPFRTVTPIIRFR